MIFKFLKTILFWLGCTISFSGLAEKQDSIDIVLIPKTTNPDYEIAKEDWLPVCQKIGKLLVRSAQGGYGAFDSFNCHYKKDKISSTNQKNIFVLEIETDEKKGMSISLKHKNSIIDNMLIKPTIYYQEILESDEFIQDIRFFVLDQMPYAIYIPAGVKRFYLSKYKEKENPEQLMLYLISYEEEIGLWKTKVVGEAKKDKNKEAADKDYYDISLTTTVSQPIFAQHVNGPGADREAIADKITTRAKVITSENEDKASQIYMLGVRKKFRAQGTVLKYMFSGVTYGIPLLKSNQLSDNLSSINIVGEFRQGWMKGLRLSDNLWPKVSENLAVGSQMFQGNRFNIEYIYRYEINPIFSINAMPQVSYWNILGAFPRVDSLMTTNIIKVDSAYSLGVGGGIELRLSKLLLWAAGQAVVAHFGNANSLKFYNSGIYSLLQITDFFIMKEILNAYILSSVHLENFSVESKQQRILSFNQVYFSLGAAIGW